MGDRERNVADMFNRTLVLDAANAADYAAVALAATSFAIVQSAADALEEFFAEQTSGEASMAVEQKSVLKAAIRRKMREYSKTARALKIDAPGFDKLVQVPDGKNEGILSATGREFVEVANQHAAAFASLGLPNTRAAELAADLDALEAANVAKAQGTANTVGATAGIDQKIDEGMDAEIVLDAIMHNVYRDDPVKLAAWISARHVRRIPRPSPPPPTPTPTP